MNKKGFTLIELLATILILGLLTTIVSLAFTTIINKSKNNYYTTQEDMLKLAGQDYFLDYRSKLPKEIGETSNITLKQLIKEGYIENIKDQKGNDCDFEKSYVKVEKIKDNDYKYNIKLICKKDNYETKN